MSNEKIPVIHQRRVWLNQIIVDILKENPDGINKLYFWNIVGRKAKSLGPCRSYGVNNMNSLLGFFENIEEVKIDNVTFIKLKSDASPNETLKSKVNCLKVVIFKILCSHGGKVKRSLLWNMVAQEQGRAVVASDYGVSNIYEVLKLMPDIISEIKVNNELYVKLTKSPSHIRFLDESFKEEFPTLTESMNQVPKLPSLSELSDTVMQILSGLPDGIELDEIWNVYKQKTGKAPPKPQHYQISNNSDFFHLAEFKNIKQFTKNGKTWLALKSWENLNPQGSDVNIASCSRDTSTGKSATWGAPADLDFQNSFKVSQSMFFNMQQILPSNSQAQKQKDIEDSLYLSQKPIVPTVNLRKKSVTVNPINLTRGKTLSKEQLDSFAKECIEIISDAQDYVSCEKIEKLLLQRLGRSRLIDIGLKDIEQLKSVYEHNRLLCKVNAYVQAFVKVRSICTLKELEESISDYVISGEKFECLKLGPLHRLPVVFDMFKYPVDEEEFPDIHTMDIMQKVRDFLTEKKKWTERLQMEEVMTYLIEVYEVSTPYHLGIRIRSLPLVVGVLKRAQSDAARNRRAIYDGFKKEIEEELKVAFANFRQGVIYVKSQKKTIKEHYLKLDVVTAMNEIYQKLIVLMNIEEPATRTERKQKQKRLQCFEAFLEMLTEDKLAQLLFHVAICVSNTELQEAAMEILAPSSPQPAVSDTVETFRESPSKEKILQNLTKYLSERINLGSLSLSHLDKIEGKLLEDFNFPTFTEMGYGRFIKFLLSDPSTKQLLEECGVSLLGLSSGNVGDSLYQPQFSDVLNCVQQCMDSGAKQPHLIEGALCHHYAVKDVKKLGFGTVQRLVANSERKIKTHSTNVLFEAALCATQRSLGQIQGNVGILGHQTREAALAILHNCPLLEDMTAWSHWPLVFEPQFGKLKDFVNKYGGEKNIPLEGGIKSVRIDILALEIEHGKYLKLVSQTSVELFTNACTAGDVLRTCGHLVSIIAHNKGLDNAPFALLANHMKTALFSLQGTEISASDSPYAGKPAKFVLHCLVKLPLQICVSLANQIFLEPLGQVIGQTKSKLEILKYCSSISDSNRLEELGYLLGINDWADSLIKLKSSFLKDQIETIAELESEDEFVDANEIEEESSEEEESESLSDDEDKEILEKSEGFKMEEVAAASVSEEMENQQNIEDDIGEKEEEDENKQTKDESKETTDAETEKPTEESNVHKELISLICREEFGIGFELNEDGKKLMRRQQERLGRSLDRLSKDLYSKDSHFVLELVQNADDNSYPEEFSHKDSKQRPSVKFCIDNSSVTVLNNECGFREKDIRALCDVGKSTKGKHKFGYIGQKGIGFKSVFRVTDTPQVHSNKYHIYFDVNSGPMGYIQPHWIEDYEEIEEGWVTKIVLPLKESVKKSKSLAASFNDIHPSLLLFLHRLKEITIDNKVENSQTKMCRYDLENNVVEIRFDTIVNQWLVVKKLLDASDISSQVKSDVEVESSEIALAFPLSNNSSTHSLVLPPKQPVFAFLPLRSYGFRFIIQGDFDLPSSREDVDKDSPWNQWLKNEIPTLFLESLEQFKVHPNFKSVIHAVTAYLQFVPGEDEVLDFFRPVAAHILKKLRSKPCIPTQPLTKDTNILWKLPSQTVIVPDMLMREVATPEMLQKLLNLYYVHSDMTHLLNSSLAHSLGIEKLTTDHLLKIGEAIATTWKDITSVEPDHMLLISKWLACVYRSLDDFESNEDILTKICNIKIIPISDGRLTALKDESVFLSLKNTQESSKQKNKDSYLELWKDLNSIHPDLLCTDDAEINSQVHKIILQLGIKELFPSNIIQHHILPVLQGDEWKTKSPGLLVDYVCYIKEQSEKNPQLVNFDQFISIIQIKTNHGMKNPCETSIHFTPAYGNSIDLKKDLSGYDWVFLDNCYVKGISQKSVIQSWHEFLSKLGVTNFLAVKSISVLVNPQNYLQSPWEPFYQMWPCTDDGSYEVKDFSCPEFEYLVKHNTNKNTYTQQMQKLCELLDRDWDSYYSKYIVTSVYFQENQHAVHETQSSFAINLQQLPWLPAKQTCLITNFDKVSTEIKISHQKPNIVYLNSHKLESLLGHTVFYLAANLSSNSSFSSFLQIKSVISADTIVNLLIKWGNRPDETSKIPTEFCTSLSHIKSVYRYLCDELNNKRLQDLFHTKPVVFVPNNDNVIWEQNDNFVGKMYKREELWWDDSTRLFKKYHSHLVKYQMSCSNKKEIANTYGDMLDFFYTAVRVFKYPQLYEYGELIQVLTYSLPEEVLKDVLALFNLIGEKMFLVSHSKDPTLTTVFEEDKKKLLKQIQNEAIFPTKNGLWVSLAEHPIIADDKELEKMFSDKAVHFVCLTAETKEKKFNRKSQQNQERERNILEFLKLCGVAKLSESYTQDPITEHYMPFPELQAYMHKVMPILQRYLFTNYLDIFNTWKEEWKLHDDLPDWKFAKINKLEVIYTLKQKPDIIVVQHEKCLIENKEFKVQVNAATSEHDIDRYIARYLSLGNIECLKNLKLFLHQLRSNMNNEDMQNLEDKLVDVDIGPLPSDEPLWFVPEPIQLSTPSPVSTPIPVFTNEISAAGQANNNKEKLNKGAAIPAWPPCASASMAKLNTYAPTQGNTEKGTSMWPMPKGPTYNDQIQNISTKFTIASSQPVASGDNQNQDPAYCRSSSTETRENSGQESFKPPSDQVARTKNVDDYSEPRRDGFSRSTSQSCIDTTNRTNEDVTCLQQSLEDRRSRTYNYDTKSQEQSQNVKMRDQSQSPEHSNLHSTSRKRLSEGGMEPDAKRHPEPSFGIPIWLQSAQDLEYEELTVSSDLKIPDSIIDQESKDYNSSTGRWGENLVFNYLLQQKIRSNSYIFSVVWVNEMKESGKPFDFEIKLYDTDSTNKSLYTVYIEVKSTLFDKKEAFEISGPEVQFALEQKANFHIYRVYNAGNAETVRIVKIENLASQIDQKNVRLCLLI